MNFDETPMNPADLAAMTESAPKRRTRKAGGHPRDATHVDVAASELIAEGQEKTGDHNTDADRNPLANECATTRETPICSPPLVSNPLAGHHRHDILTPLAGNPIPDAATHSAQPSVAAPCQETLNAIIELHRMRQDMIKAMTKLSLQAQGLLRRATGLGKDDNVSGLMKDAAEDPAHRFHMAVMPYLAAQEPLALQRDAYEKALVKLAKTLPVYGWVKSVKGFGDISFASIVGECGDIGSYKSVSALWKRMGLAVIGANRQGNPGKGATADDWIAHGYSKVRRSVMWNVGNSLILAMGKFRPLFGEDVQAATGDNGEPKYTYFQRVFAERVRYEAERLPNKDGTPIKCSATGKESYSLHAANRAKRYVEKRLLRELYKEWRAA